MKLKIWGLALMIACALLGKVNAQAIDFIVDKREEVTIQSWKQGTETIKNQQIKLALSSKNKKYKQEIVGDSGKRYKLVVYHNPYSDLDLEHWEVQLYEILSEKDKSKELLSPRLLTLEPDGPGKHVFWQEDYASILYPEEEPHVISAKNEGLWGEGYGFYYFKTIRKINIESFCMVIKVGDYKFNQKNENKLDLFEVFIEFTSTCKAN